MVLGSGRVAWPGPQPGRAQETVGPAREGIRGTRRRSHRQREHLRRQGEPGGLRRTETFKAAVSTGGIRREHTRGPGAEARRGEAREDRKLHPKLRTRPSRALSPQRLGEAAGFKQPVFTVAAESQTLRRNRKARPIRRTEKKRRLSLKKNTHWPREVSTFKQAFQTRSER